MKLEIGKRYRLRNGSTTGPLAYSASAHKYPWRCDRRGITWEESGRQDSSLGDTAGDIVAEYTEPQPSPPDEVQQLREQYNRQAETIDKLTDQNRNQLKVINGLRDQLAEKAQQLDQRTDELTRAQHTVEEALETIDGLQTIIDVKTNVIESQDKMIESWRRCYNDMRTDRDSLAAERNTLQDELNERKRSHDALQNLYHERCMSLHTTTKRLGEAQERIEWLEKELQELQQTHKPLQWERRLPTADECYTSFIIEKRKNGIIMGYGPKETSATSWGEDAEFVCILPAILPAVEPPKPVIERLWILEHRNMDAEPQLQWFDRGMTPSLGTWHRTEITREKVQ
jgi:hypothetical protein